MDNQVTRFQNTFYFYKPNFISCKDLLLLNRTDVKGESHEDSSAIDGVAQTGVYRSPITIARCFVDSINEYFQRLQENKPRTVLLFQFLRAGAIIARELLCSETVVGSSYNKRCPLSTKCQLSAMCSRLLFWSGIPLYLASSVLKDPIGNTHQLFFTFELLCGKHVKTFGHLTPLVVLLVPILYRYYLRPLVMRSGSPQGISTLTAIESASNDTIIWPLVGKYFNEYILMRIPYYKHLIEACTSDPDEGIWFGNILGCLMLVFAKDIGLWLIKRKYKF
ncbi:uncharacterized protein Ecym_2145 [Eremothecium cymbalariae DBVPG|uniref:Uncharacterized protein n=1 Tax=Eremothecium cymbalariae (strain CBS 270.75 / DBVPG 7215 / KCTC 17166 / NRRL Y-17582) TaxID=931890 RepID=G8JNI1_ERECY|nr:Hypothetical protein Ecym_2145 [Eremothecium cymbalariae DBVPG\